MYKASVKIDYKIERSCMSLNFLLVNNYAGGRYDEGKKEKETSWASNIEHIVIQTHMISLDPWFYHC